MGQGTDDCIFYDLDLKDYFLINTIVTKVSVCKAPPNH